MVLVDLACPPPWFVQQQAHDHLQLQEAAAFAGTDGEGLGTVSVLAAAAVCLRHRQYVSCTGSMLAAAVVCLQQWQ
jgi:hypothetical protein